MGIPFKHWRMWLRRKLFLLTRPLALGIILAAEQILDMVSTLIAVYWCGGIEFNPFVVWMLGWSPWLFVGVKLLATLVLGLVVPRYAGDSKGATSIWSILALFYLAIILSNFIQILVFWLI